MNYTAFAGDFQFALCHGNLPESREYVKISLEIDNVECCQECVRVVDESG